MQRMGLIALLFFLSTPGWAETFQGQVVDARTGQPIERAVVLGRWPNAREIEVETNAEGRFMFDRPSEISPRQELVLVYRFGYVVWINTDVFDPNNRPNYFRPRSDRSLPPQIRVEPFPQKGNRARQLWLLVWTLEADGHKERRPKLWNAIQQEIAETFKQCQPSCE